jgi:hypothetical protein
VAELDWTEVLQLRDRVKPPIFAEALLQFAGQILLAADEPVLAEYVAYLGSARAFFDQHAQQLHRKQRREVLGRMLPIVLIGDVDFDWDKRGAASSEFQRMLQQAPSGQVRIGYIIRSSLAMHTPEDERATAYLLRTIPGIDEEFSARYADVLAEVESNVLLNVGAEFANTGELRQASVAYGNALDFSLTLGEVAESRELIRRLREVIHASKEDLSLEYLWLLIRCGLRYERLVGEAGTLELQEIASLACAHVFRSGVSSGTTLTILLQVAKGRAFALCASNPISLKSSEDPDLSSLLQGISETASRIAETAEQRSTSDEPAGAPIGDDGLLEEELLRLSYARPVDPIGGTDDGSLLTNLRYKFGNVLRAKLLRGAGHEEPVYCHPSDIRARLDDRTILVDLYLGSNSRGQLTLYCACYTSDVVGIGSVLYPELQAAPLLRETEHRQLISSAIAASVAEVRLAIEMEPGFAVVSEEAELTLREMFGRLLFALEGHENLRESGRDHLCIVPNGPLHFLPFHLLPGSNGIVADAWKVSYLPHISLSLRPKIGIATGGSAFCAIGKSFATQNPRGLPVLDDAVAETCEVAEIMGVSPILDEQATPENVLAALKCARYAHISTHGEQDPTAPAFHTLFLTPDQVGNDTLRAHQIYAEDLSCVDLITLSACETALGRYDLADNLDGLPASLLIAGVRTIVGTLWNVDALVSRTFFCRLYAMLLGGERKIDAFVSAQSETRQLFRAYRDWGSFYLIGAWD